MNLTASANQQHPAQNVRTHICCVAAKVRRDSHIFGRKLEGVLVGADLLPVFDHRVPLDGLAHIVDAERLHEPLQDVHHAGLGRQTAQLAITHTQTHTDRHT